MTLFPLGHLVASSKALAAVADDPTKFIPILDRHAKGDWGDVDEHDREVNDAALHYGSRIMSAYSLEGVKLWVITEADRSSTTVLLPDEY